MAPRRVIGKVCFSISRLSPFALHPAPASHPFRIGFVASVGFSLELELAISVSHNKLEPWNGIEPNDALIPLTVSVTIIGRLRPSIFIPGVKPPGHVALHQ